MIRGKICIVIWVNLNTESEALGKKEALVVFRKLAKHLPYILVQELAEEPSKGGWRNIWCKLASHPASVPSSAEQILSSPKAPSSKGSPLYPALSTAAQDFVPIRTHLIPQMVISSILATNPIASFSDLLQSFLNSSNSPPPKP